MYPLHWILLLCAGTRNRFVRLKISSILDRENGSFSKFSFHFIFWQFCLQWWSKRLKLVVWNEECLPFSVYSSSQNNLVVLTCMHTNRSSCLLVFRAFKVNAESNPWLSKSVWGMALATKYLNSSLLVCSYMVGVLCVLLNEGLNYR